MERRHAIIKNEFWRKMFLFMDGMVLSMSILESLIDRDDPKADTIEISVKPCLYSSPNMNIELLKCS